MPRAPRDHRLETPSARTRLKVRTEPYWRCIVPGLFIGYRRGKKSSAWVRRQRQADGSYTETRLGIADDHAAADGMLVLSFAQAVKQAQEAKPGAPTVPRHVGGGLTLNAVVRTYLADRQTNPGGRSGRVMSSSTARMSEQVWNRHAASTIGARLVRDLTARDLRDWHAGIVKKPPTVRGKPQPFDRNDPDQVRSRRASANRVLTIAKAALSYAWINDLLPADQASWWAKVKPFALGDDPVPRMLDGDEITRLLNAAPEDLRLVLTGALMTGGRAGELRAMRTRDFDADNGVVRVFQTKTGKTLVQPLTPEGDRFFQRAVAGRAPDDLIFVRADGRPWARSDLTRPMAVAVAKAGLADVSFKTTRATYGKLLLLATRDLELVAKALGHSDSRITRRHYAALLPGEVAAGIAKLRPLGIVVDTSVEDIGARRRRALK